MLLGSRSLSLASRTVSSLHRERLWVAGRGLPFPEPAQGQGLCPIQSFSQREGHFQLLGWNLVLWGVRVFGFNEEVLGEREPASTQSEKGQMCQGWFSGQQTWALLVRQEVLGLHAHTAVMFWLPEYCLKDSSWEPLHPHREAACLSVPTVLGEGSESSSLSCCECLSPNQGAGRQGNERLVQHLAGDGHLLLLNPLCLESSRAAGELLPGE